MVGCWGKGGCSRSVGRLVGRLAGRSWERVRSEIHVINMILFEEGKVTEIGVCVNVMV